MIRQGARVCSWACLFRRRSCRSQADQRIDARGASRGNNRGGEGGEDDHGGDERVAGEVRRPHLEEERAEPARDPPRRRQPERESQHDMAGGGEQDAAADVVRRGAERQAHADLVRLLRDERRDGRVDARGAYDTREQREDRHQPGIEAARRREAPERIVDHADVGHLAGWRKRCERSLDWMHERDRRRRRPYEEPRAGGFRVWEQRKIRGRARGLVGTLPPYDWCDTDNREDVAGTLAATDV